MNGKIARERPVVFGEVLFDVFPDGREVLGGAPLNVAWHLAGFGLEPLFVSRVGRDARGDAITERMRMWGMDLRGLQRDEHLGTGVVQVSFENGEPRYEIVPDRAFDAIAWSPLAELLAGTRPSVVVHGTLAVRGEVSARTLAKLMGEGATGFVDVNLRDPWWDHEGVAAMLARSRWAKLNEAELRVFEPEGELATAASRLSERYGFRQVVVTRGGEGALVWTAGDGVCEVKPHEVNVVDTVGAGDAFTAVFVAGLLRGWSTRETLVRAGEFAATVCRQRGAVSDDREVYARCRRDWSLDEPGGTID